MNNSGPWVFRDGKLVSKREAAAPPRGPRSGIACPMLIRDQMDALQGMHDGKFYESKSELRRSYKEGGFVELGNDAPTTPKAPERPGGFKDDVQAAYKKVRDGYKPQIETMNHAPNQTGWNQYVD